MSNPVFVTIRPGLRVNLCNVAYTETMLEPETARPAIGRPVALDKDDMLVHFVGKRQPQVIRGADAAALSNFLDGVSMQLVASGSRQSDPLSDLRETLESSRFSGLTGS